MKTRKLSEGLEVSDLGYGAMSLSHGYGEATDRKDAVKILSTGARLRLHLL